MLSDISLGLWFFLPAAIANMAPVVAAAIPMLKHWSAPIDGGRTCGNQPLLGSHKTWRGLASGMAAATLTLWLQQSLVHHTSWAASIVQGLAYSQLPMLLLGPVLGFGALGGDAAKSFVKRRRRIREGGTWIPFDQLDSIIGAVLVSLPFVLLPPMVYVWIILLWFVLHVSVSYTAWKLGLKERPI